MIDILVIFFCRDRPQELREEALKKFRKNEIQVIVATDVCARGIDIKDLDHVSHLFHYFVFICLGY